VLCPSVWSLACSLPRQSSVSSVSCRTSKGLPLYKDDDDSDVFVLASFEDLITAFRKVSGKKFAKDKWGDFEFDVVVCDGHEICRY